MFVGFRAWVTEEMCPDAATMFTAVHARFVWPLPTICENAMNAAPATQAATVWLVAKADQGPVQLGNLRPRMQAPCSPATLLVHGWDRIKNLNVYSSLGLSTHKNVKCYPTMTKI